MLGRTIYDPQGVESAEGKTDGLGLLPVSTTFEVEKQTVRARGCVLAKEGLFAGAQGLEMAGYEIHMGRTVRSAEEVALLHVVARGETEVEDFDGACSADGWVAGTYFHGLFENDRVRHSLLTNLALRRGITRAVPLSRFDRGSCTIGWPRSREQAST
jgi:adenosylcobyric acid synthase